VPGVRSRRGRGHLCVKGGVPVVLDPGHTPRYPQTRNSMLRGECGQ
jgi:hypothetical protein